MICHYSIVPNPISRQCPDRFRAIPIDSPVSGTTGILSDKFIESLFVLVTCPTVIEVLRESIRSSLTLISWTLSWVPVPKTSSKSVCLIVMLLVISGSFPSVDATLPDSPSAFVKFVSSSVSIAREPPG